MAPAGAFASTQAGARPGAEVNRLPRGLAAAVSASVAVHAALVAGHWPASGSPGAPAVAPTVITARLIGPAAVETSPVTMPSATTPPMPAPEATVPTPSAVEPTPRPPPATAAMPRPADPVPAPPPAAEATSPGGGPAVPNPIAAPPPAGTGAESRTLGVDRGPQPLDDIEAAFPPSAAPRGGVVTVRLAISERGLVERVTLLRSSAPGLIDEATLAAALARVRFSPGLRGGAPARAEVVYEIDFAALGKGADTSGKTY